MGVYRHWVDTPEAMDSFREMYRIPANVSTRVDDPDDMFDGFVFADGWMPFPLVAIVEGGVRFPVHPLLRACLSTWHLSPCQLMPNGYKVIMGAVELNRILGINLGVHDIEDAYDVCKSAGDGTCFYLRGRPGREQFVTELEDSGRHAGNDRLFVSGNWEFGEDETAAEKRYRIPCHFGIPLKVSQRKSEAINSGWRPNSDWQKAVRGYKGHNTRAAWSLLGYEPRYKTYIKRRSAGDAASPDLDRRRASGAEATTSRAEPEPDLERIIDSYSSPSSEGGRMPPRRPPLATKDLGSKFFGKEAAAPNPPIMSKQPVPTGQGSASALPSVGPPVRERPAEIPKEKSRADKGPRLEKPSSSRRERPAGDEREGAPEKRPRTEGPAEKAPGRNTEQAPGASSAVPREGPAIWRPSLLLGPGRPVTVDDRLHGNPAVAATFAGACALPQDIERLQRMEDGTLMVGVIQSAFSIIQRAKVAMDRVQHRDTRVEKLEAEKKKVTDALEGVCKNLKEEEEKNFSLVKDLEAAVNEVCKVKEESVALKAAAEVKAKRAIQLEAELEEARAELKKKDAELKRKSAELEVVCKEKAHVEATTQAEVDAAFNDGVGEATKDYERQLEVLGPRLFELGCRAVLKKMAVSKDDPIYQDLPKLEPQASEESSVPPQAPAAAPALEAPVAEAAPEVPPDTPSEK
ncbi:hypothetical protein CKAN_02715400 [Cinnamomum micranthum f. kanehirae]|uniref:Uncharacterized protein n=1 Tax=Cinnamomum micranthum f. kanehirae TaxID=337451 RepID=A0A443Q3T1_9MAGN|nr:hypothetical protein CKAN_02715400 [Cinnamomum micranthum f. kanehirae]